MTVSVGVLGPLAVSVSGSALKVGGRREQALLCLLIARADQTVSVDRLADDLWDGDPPEGASKTLRAYVSKIRRALGDAASELLVTEAPGYRIASAAADIDVVRFEALVAQGQALREQGDSRGAADRFRDALALFRGTPFAQVADTTWGQAESLRLEEERLAALEARIEADLECGRHDQLVGELDALCTEHPLREGLWAKRMLALYRAGRQAEALRAYQDLRTHLGGELGIEPSTEVRDLEMRMLRHDPSLGHLDGSHDPPRLPTGVVTFLFTDIEESTRAWESDPAAAAAMVRAHDAQTRELVESHGGCVFKQTGDGMCAAFDDTIAALQAAIGTQRALADGSISVRMALHVGPAAPHEGDYHGPPLNRVARLLDTAHGGQIVVSSAVRELTLGAPLDAVTLIDLGEFHLPGIDAPERIYQLTHPALPGDFPSLRASTARRTNLPAAPADLIGRVEEHRRVVDALRNHRVATLTGAGGVGKTRLALTVAEHLVDEFVDGVWLCSLEALRDASTIDDLTAASLRISPRQGEPARKTLLDVVKDRHFLIVFDNCEHLIAAVADLVAALVDAGPRVHVLATSREGLAIRGEQVIPVPSLRIPDLDAELADIEKAEAIQLFVVRAREVQPDFALDHDNAASVAAICTRLDGVPLAIELAAARVGVLSPRDLSSRLDQSFRVLTGRNRGAVDRHQTLQRVIDWSHALLDEDERGVFAALSVFAGGFGLEDAEALAASHPGLDELDALDVVARLVEKSMVVAEPRGASVRYRMLESIRHYANERFEESGTSGTLRQWHAEWYLDVAERAAALFSGPGEADGIGVLTREVANLRAALEWFVAQGQAEPAVRLVAPMRYEILPPSLAREVGSWAATVVDQLRPEDSVELERTYASAAIWNWSNGDLRAAQDIAGKARDVARRAGRPMHPVAAFTVGTVGYFCGNEDLREVANEEYYATLGEIADVSIGALSYSARGARVGIAEGDVAHGRDLAEKGLALAERAGAPSVLAFSSYVLGAIVDLPGEGRDPEQSLGLLRQAMAFDSPGAEIWKLAARSMSSALLCELGATSAGMSELRAALLAANQSLSRVEVASWLFGSAIDALSRVGEHFIVVALNAAAHSGSLGWWSHALTQSARDRSVVEASREQLEPVARAEAQTLGATLDYDTATELILSAIDRHAAS